jgi:hypothetical protein
MEDDLKKIKMEENLNKMGDDLKITMEDDLNKNGRQP